MLVKKLNNYIAKLHDEWPDFPLNKFRNIFFILLLAISLVPISLTQTQYVNASSKSPYESGYDHGCDDADISDPDDRYINQPDKGPSHHTNEFMSGYNDGYDECSEGFGDNGSSSDQSRSDIVQDFCTELNRGDYIAAEALLALLDYGSLSAAARGLCGIVVLLDN